jgi:amino acid transporter
MSASTADEPPGTERLVRALTLRDLVLFNVVAVLGLRWLSTAAKAGPGAIVLWLLATVLFFIPQGMAVIELSARHPEEGGVYAWTKHAFGEAHGFVCGWCYWINNVLFYPSLLISTAAIATYAIGRGESGLANQWPYVLTVTVIALWLAVAVNIVGLRTGKWLQNLGGIGTFFPSALVVLFGLYALATLRPANPITVRSLIPNLGDLSTLNLWASIAFAFTGLELSSTMGDEVIDPRRNLPRSIYLSAPIIAGTYIIGSVTLLWLVPAGELSIVSGFLQGINAGAGHISSALFWLAPLSALAYTLGNLGGVGAWLTGPARVAFVIGLDRYFPPAFARIHPKWHTPYVAILVQAVLATLFLFLSVLGKGTTVERAYLVLLDTQILIYFVPFIYLFLAYLKGGADIADTARTGGIPRMGRMKRLVLGVSGLGVTVFAMIVAGVPPSDSADRGLFVLKVVGGATAFLALGGVLYVRGRRR